MTRYDQQFLTSLSIEALEEDVTELAPDDYSLIEWLESMLFRCERIIIVLVLIIIGMAVWIAARR